MSESREPATEDRNGRSEVLPARWPVMPLLTELEHGVVGQRVYKHGAPDGAVASWSRSTTPCQLLLFFKNIFLAALPRGEMCGLAALLCMAPPMLFAASNPPSADAIPPLRPPRGEMPPTFWEQHGAWIVAAGLLGVALMGAAIWWLTRPKPPVVVPPGARARLALEPLRPLPEDGALLSRVSQIVRGYVAAAFDLPAGELTTTEFGRVLAAQERVGPELAAVISAFLQNCDRNKFEPPAPRPPMGAVAEALRLVELAEARRSEPVRA